MFCYAVRKQVAGMIAALDGVDMIVFTGGIGESDAVACGAICEGLSWIGVSLNESGAMVLPLLATQILWINLITDSGPALAMGVDPTTDDVMDPGFLTPVI